MAEKSKVKKLKTKIMIKKSKKKGKKTHVVMPTCDVVIQKYTEDNNATRDIQNREYQHLLRCMSNRNRDHLQQDENVEQYLYPIKDDKKFNSKIAKKKEFFDTRYEEKTPEDYEHIIEISQQLCDNTEFELEPHQMFVRNFLSFETPYNSLLLYHGLGTGKTCSAISVSEEMRTYNKQIGNPKRIIIVASPAVQENFKIQLFDERKLKNVNGLWSIKACIGNKFIKEINPMNMKGLKRSRIIRQIKKLIHQSYLFQGYIEFSHYITRIMNKNITSSDTPDIKERKKRRSLQKEFNNRMIVIDEVHNLRINEEGKIKQSSENLIDLVSYTNHMKLMILSATPMFNSYTEIIWLLNLLNLNDKRYPISEKEVFDKNGDFCVDNGGHQIGKDLLIQKLTGYISYVRGENPFTFPNSIWPSIALNPNSLITKLHDGIWKYPSRQLNGGTTVPHLTLFDLVITNIGDYQSVGYNFIIQTLQNKYPNLKDPKKGISYTFLEAPLQALNMIYPHTGLKEDEIDEDISTYLYGRRGLARTMNYDPRTKRNFRYKDKTLQNFGKIFSTDKIGQYSGKIKYIMDTIKRSRGIVFIYSQYIDGGAVPIALALEEMGFGRYQGKNLFETPPSHPIDALTLTAPADGKLKYPAQYIMITGDKNLTGNVKAELKAATGENNTNGEIVKVIIISRAGSEGLDFKNIRQMHILDPWYNYNRQKQIVGRAVRNFSHCALPYIERNVEIYMYGTELKEPDVEAVDLYIYRLAEKKAKQIAVVTRVIKENAVDCLLNSAALDFSQKKINKVVKQKLSNGGEIDFKLGDKENSEMCDFMKCEYSCSPVANISESIDIQTYNENFINMNLDKILQRIRILFGEKYIYKKTELIKNIQHIKHYPLEQIYSALNFLVNEKNEYITDLLGRLGNLVNIGEYYMFQPVEIDNKHISRYERAHPIDFKRKSVSFNLPDQISNFNFIAPYSKKSLESYDIDTQPLLNTIESQLISLKIPTIMSSENKNNWVMHCAWAIQNLIKYNKMKFEQLLNYAMNHVLDLLTFNEKFILLNYITQKKTDFTELDKYIDNYFKQTKISGGRYDGIVIAQFNKPASHEQYTILTNKDGRWINDRRAITGGLAQAMFDKFQIKDISIKTINKIIGFMTNFKGTQIVFKTKNIEQSERGRSNKGQRCDRGEGKNSIIRKINAFLGEKGEKEKYEMGQQHKSSLCSIYGHKNIKQEYIGKEGKIETKINTLQLCVENELILRHHNHTRKDNKRWFFSSVDTIINNIEKLKI